MKGIFLNSPKAQCSIHESGKMVFDALQGSDVYELDYMEITERDRSFTDSYDFMVFNYHPFVMGWLDTRTIQNLPGLKMTFILETLPDNPFPMCPIDAFDIYCPLDPTIRIDDPRVYPFPRPLEPPFTGEIKEPDTPTIGTFGFATAGKGFETVVDAVSMEFDRAIVRINVPMASHIGKPRTILPARPMYADKLIERCMNVAGDGIDVRITTDYMTKQELIRWCSENTLNCFLYNRNQPGLSATTDQAISSGRPLSVSANETFRHIHEYLTPYPDRSLKESIAVSVPEVKKMQDAWSRKNFIRRFEGVLLNHAMPHKRTFVPVTIGKKNPIKTFYDVNRQRLNFFMHPVDEHIPKLLTGGNNVLMISQTERVCGIYQYGRNITNSLRKSRRFKFIFCECGNRADYEAAVDFYDPVAIIYNYYPPTMRWVNARVTRKYRIPHLAIIHEFDQRDADRTTNAVFDYSLYQDPCIEIRNPYAVRTKQLLYPYTNTKPLPEIPTIGSFGFGFADKGFDRLVLTVQEEFDEAVINLHMPWNEIVDRDGMHAKNMARICRELITKPGITLNITHEFWTEPELLDFLAGNTVNAFFTDVNKYLGISGAIHHALAVHRPIAVTKCPMYKHILNAKPSICIEDTTLRQIIANGTEPLEPFYKAWSEEAFIADYERIIDIALEGDKK